MLSFQDPYTACITAYESGLSEAGTDVPSVPETAAQLNTTATKRGLATARASVSGSSQSYLGQQGVALPRRNTLDKSSQIRGI